MVCGDFVRADNIEILEGKDWKKPTGGKIKK